MQIDSPLMYAFVRMLNTTRVVRKYVFLFFFLDLQSYTNHYIVQYLLAVEFKRRQNEWMREVFCRKSNKSVRNSVDGYICIQKLL